MKLRITYLIPAALVATSIIGAVLVFANHYSVKEAEVRNSALSRINLDLSRLQNILYNLVAEGHIVEARLNMSVMAMDGSVRKLLLVDDSHTILISSNYNQDGEKAKNVSNYKNSYADAVSESNIQKTHFIGDERDVLAGYYSVVTNIETQQTGIIYIEYSIKNDLFDQQQQLRKEALFYSLVLLFSAVIVAILLHVLISRRLVALTRSAQILAQGEFNRSMKLGGDDEITNLSLVFEEMRLRIRDFIKAKEDSARDLRVLNESLEERIDERTKSLAEAQKIAKVGSWYWDIQANIVIWSDETYRIFGYEKDEIDLTLDAFLSRVHPDDVDFVREEVEKALSTDDKYDIDHRIVLRDGSVKWLHGEGYVEYGELDTDTIMNGIVQDITEHKQEQEQREALEMQLMQSQKMESIGQLTGGIAHDFNNILASVLGFTELAKKISDGYHDEKLSGYLEQINASGNRAVLLVSQMLTFSRVEGDIHDIESIPVASLVEKSAKMLEPLIPSSIKFNVLNNVGGASASVNPHMIEQVLVNLTLNARDAIENEIGTIVISIDRVNAEGVQCSSCRKLIAGLFISINVSDTGAGIEKDILNRIFDPFFTTKPVGKGTGMGLSMVHGIVHKHGGHIAVDSSLGEGAKFNIFLPESTCEVSKEEKVIKNADITKNERNKGHILVVDDEEFILIYLQELLELEGYQVTTMSNGIDAEKYFLGNANNIDVVITDQTMPGMSGDELIESILLVKPDLPIILCSGFSEKIDEEKAMSLGVKGFMKKPVMSQDLLSRLEIILS